MSKHTKKNAAEQQSKKKKKESKKAKFPDAIPTVELQTDETAPPPLSKPGKRNASLSKGDLIALTTDSTSKPAEIQITFTSGIGQVTALLFRKGVLINMQSISNSGIIRFAEVQTMDAISVNGICTGKAVISINVPTDPVTPSPFSAQNIHIGYDVL